MQMMHRSQIYHLDHFVFDQTVGCWFGSAGQSIFAVFLLLPLLNIATLRAERSLKSHTFADLKTCFCLFVSIFAWRISPEIKQKITSLFPFLFLLLSWQNRTSICSFLIFFLTNMLKKCWNLKKSETQFFYFLI